MKLKPVELQVAVVFGASSGIGRETARRFAARGAQLVIAARDEDGLASLAEEIRRKGGRVLAVTADAADFGQVKAVADRAVAQYGRLDTWVHLAAVTVYASFAETTPEEFRRVLEVNLLGQIHGALAALPYLRRAGGALIHISSVEGRRALPYQSAYAASKHGIKGFLDALRMELAHEDVPVSVTEVMPASVNTPLFNKARTKLGVKPMGVPPIYQPELVAEAILHAAEHPRREIVIGGAGKMITLTERFAPGLMDRMLRPSFALQKTDEPKAADAPDSLFAPLPGFDRVEGDFGSQARRHSLYTWTEIHPWARRMLQGALLGTAALAVVRLSRNGR